MVSNTDLAWLAGIMDGEGCIYGHWINKVNKNGGSVAVEVRIESTSLAMITKIASVCKELGVIVTVDFNRFRPRATRHSHRVNIRRWQEVLKLLSAIRPYLVVKSAEADAALSWYQKWGDQRGGTNGRASREEKVIFFDSLRSLKKHA